MNIKTIILNWCLVRRVWWINFQANNLSLWVKSNFEFLEEKCFRVRSNPTTVSSGCRLTDKSPCCVNFQFILLVISDIEIGIALILLMMSIERIFTRELISQFLVGVVKSLTSAFSLMLCLLLGLTFSIKGDYHLAILQKKLCLYHFLKSNETFSNQISTIYNMFLSFGCNIKFVTL